MKYGDHMVVEKVDNHTLRLGDNVFLWITDTEKNIYPIWYHEYLRPFYQSRDGNTWFYELLGRDIWGS